LSSGNGDGWGERARAAALTVGLIFCTLFHQGKSAREKVGLNFCLLFDQAKSGEKKSEHPSCQLLNNGSGIDVGYGLGKTAEINTGVVIGPVGNDSDYRERHPKLLTNLCHSSTFHLYTQHLR